MTCTITGTLIDPAGVVLPNTSVLFTARSRVAAVEGDVRVPLEVTTTSNSSGELNFTLTPGAYRGEVVTAEQSFTFNFSVSLGTSSADLATLIDQLPPVTPAVLAQAQAAQVAAQNSANSAAASATNATTSANQAATAGAAALNSANNAQAAQSAAQSAEDVAQSSANSAASSASDAANSASGAATSAAAAASSAIAADGSADVAAASATETQGYAASALAARDTATARAGEAATSATNAASSASAAASSASSAAGTVATVQAAETAVIAARDVTITNAQAASTSATNAAASATSASGSAALALARAEAAQDAQETAETFANNASTSATNAANSATAASTSAGGAATSATNAASSASAAAVSAANTATNTAAAGVSAAAALTARTGAEDARDAAATSATNAAASASAASSSAGDAQTSAQTILDTFGALEDIIEARDDAQAAASSAITSEGNASGSAASALAIYGSVDAQQQAIIDAQAAASRAEGFALSASTAQQQDLSGINVQALHRSPNAITAMFLYDTSKDSDGGAWTEKCQHTSWYNEPIMGKWLGPQASEFSARNEGATLGPQLVTNGDFSNGTTGWSGSNATLTASSGILTVTNSIADNGLAGSTGFATVVGKTYRVTANLVSASTTAALRVAATASGAAIASIAAMDRGQNSFVFVATSTTTHVQIRNGNAGVGQESRLSNISVREVTALTTASGDYFQLTTDGRFYRLWKNLLSSSRDPFITVSGVVQKSDAGVNAPTGDQYVRITELAGTGSGKRFFNQTLPTTAGRMIFSFYAKENTGGREIRFRENTSTGFAFAFNPSTGGVSSYAGGASASNVFVETVAAGVYRVSCAIDFTVSANRLISLDIAVPGGSITYAGDGVSGYDITSVQLEAASAVSTYELKAVGVGNTSEVFRGNKRDFPRLAGIVAEAANVTIYDLTEPGRPMWMRFVVGGGLGNGDFQTRSISAVNGSMAVCTAHPSLTLYGGLMISRFPSDDIRYHGRITTDADKPHGYWRGGISSRNSGGWDRDATLPIIVNAQINSVAMTVLPDAPMDPATGLRVPTIAVATGGGVSVIKHNGTVVNSANSNPFSSVSINPYMVSGQRVSSDFHVAYGSPHLLPAAFNTLTRFSGQEFSAPIGGFSFGFGRGRNARFGTSSNVAKHIRQHESDYTKSLSASIAPNFNTGWMTGDVRRCFLSDTEVGSAAQAEVWTSGFSADGWTGDGATVTSGGSSLSFAFTGVNKYAFKAFSTVIGKTYLLDVTVSGSSRNIFVSTGGVNGNPVSVINAGNRVVRTFVATQNFYTFGISANSVTTETITALSVREAIADRSYKAASATINGTITRAQLASGTSLVGYSGFSAANYLREPYSADLDFGTGEWTASAWVNIPVTLPVGSFPVIGPELVTNGDFSDLSGWFLAVGSETALTSDYIVDGALQYTSAGATTQPGRALTQSVQSGKVYRLNFRARKVGATSVSAQIRLSDRYGANVAAVWSGGNIGTEWVDYSVLIAPSATRSHISVRDDQAVGGTVAFDNISLREVGAAIITDRAASTGARFRLGVTGTGRLEAEAFDGTTTRTVTTTASYNTAQWLKARVNYTTDGTLAILVNGREVAATRGNPLGNMTLGKNLLPWSEGVDNPVWIKNQITVVPNVAVAPDGTMTADKIIGTTATGEKFLYQTVTVGGANVISFYAKEAEYYLVRMIELGAYAFYATFNLRTGAVTASGGANFVSASAVPVGNGWYRCSIANTRAGACAYSIGGFPDTIAPTNVPASYTGDGISGVFFWGAQLEPGSTATAYAATNVAPLTIGNSFALDAPFPGSIALLKLGATVPTAEQATFTVEQEKQLFRADALSVLPDSNAIVDMSYDDATDRWVSVSATNESYWTGLVRNSVTPVPAGSYTRVVATSGVELSARSTTNPGVDVTIPPYGLREELVKRAEAAARLNAQLATYDYVGGFTANTTNGSTAITSVANLTYPTSYVGARISGAGIPANTTIVGVSGTTIYLSAAATASATGVSISFLDFRLPVGMEARAVFSAGVQQREGSTAAFTRLFDGFVETIRFATAPGATTIVQVQAARGIVQ